MPVRFVLDFDVEVHFIQAAEIPDADADAGLEVMGVFW